MLCQDLNNLARKIIAQNQYMIIGSSSESNAWVSPVVYAPDSDYNLYFVSLPNSKHSENIASNSQTCISIFNSHQPFGEGVGLQIEGEAQQVNNSELVHAIRIYATRKWPYSNNILKTYIEGFKKVLNPTPGLIPRRLRRDCHSCEGRNPVWMPNQVRDDTRYLDAWVDEYH
ncbi:hypothetical protein CO051_01455 [Candidatus Roizmanbacteria bacterium CG_4_9_14_0_2_um_filter_39_13]|uniref:Pyridoxamine 5'-phosphate oxidase N-terminal domain-containing protein n=2 Tax=Candidatus Roizmaniibacteriota TaxID=1752723 RepID=A0A2M8F293_9BACT|nr:MAG: hypothetical protein COY15_05770 [Candidatus Roizmanbacteria bacterium CG_4_10_14_0_2_um_filter_39_12]PJC33413.1 MAG: hypothetical protein CO051_01455 [Candidatus Roizmanbacteria bacterium CG_4_9_14_0_2_um_filter_39_13]PJE62234.1 MAG: hypothetical protein COU87_00345 [Candidatus Roizmanbacteria bacterium CG10_big_fil_rev_8_21_14_0_10_39_12]